MKRIYLLGIITFSFLSAFAQVDNQAKKEVEGLIKRTIKQDHLSISLESLPKQNGCDVFHQEINNGKLTIKGSSGVALSRGFYDFIRNNQYGLVS